MSNPRQTTQQEIELQHARTVAATIDTVDEVGVGGLTVAKIIARARVSRKTFYELFNDTEDCLLAAVEQALTGVAAKAGVAYAAEGEWRAGLRAAVQVLLEFAELHRGLTRICVLEVFAAGPRVLELRDRMLSEAGSAMRRAALGPADSDMGELIARGLVGGAVDLLHSRLLADEKSSLSDLQGPILSMIVMPYLGRAAAMQELHRIPSGAPASPPPSRPIDNRPDPLSELKMRVTYRTARVLMAIGEVPGASNREVSRHAEISDQAQISKLLKRLAGLQLIENAGGGQAMGMSNEWHLTELGDEVLRAASGSDHAP